MLKTGIFHLFETLKKKTVTDVYHEAVALTEEDFDGT